MTICLVRSAPMNPVDLADAKAHLSELIDRVEAGMRSTSLAVAESRKPIDATMLQALTAAKPSPFQNASGSCGRCETTIATDALPRDIADCRGAFQ
jgi:hypothetical protein